MRAGTRIGTGFLAFYPEPWRERYGVEMRALLEDDPPGTGGLASLLAGAAQAHVRPRRCWRSQVPPAAAMRLSVGALFASWMLISVAGSTFAKLTENMDPLEHEHNLLIAARDLITLGAFLGALAVAVGGLPLVWQALRTARHRRDRRLAAMLLAPALGGACVWLLTGVLLFVAPSRDGSFPISFVAEILAPIVLAGLGWTALGAIAPKAVMRRSEPPMALLRLAAWAGQLLAGAMLLVTAGLALYVPGLWSIAGAGAEASGPLGMSTRVTLIFALAGALAAVGPALLAAGRARRAALARV